MLTSRTTTDLGVKVNLLIRSSKMELSTICRYHLDSSVYTTREFVLIILLREMGQPQRRKKHHSGDTHLVRRWRTRSRKRDLDQVPNNAAIVFSMEPYL